MKLNKAEKALMNNPVRAVVQRRFEARLLRHMGGRTDAAAVLEIGCGRGVGAEILIEDFGAATVHAFDLDPDMVERAAFRLRRFGDRARVWQGDATTIDADDDAYDAVFDFGIIHHVPDWAAAIGEVTRVLRPGGRFFFEEVTRRALDRPISRTLFAHPETNRFTGAGLLAGLQSAGLIVDEHRELFFGDFILGVAHRPVPLRQQAGERAGGAVNGAGPAEPPVISAGAESDLHPCL